MNNFLKRAIILFILIFIFFSIIFIQMKKISSLQKENIRQSNNVSQLMEDNYSIELKTKELQDFIKNSDSEFAKKIDSIITINNIKIKNLQKIIRSQTTITLTDTIYLASKPIYIQDDSLYHSEYIMDSTCISVRGRVISKDPMPTITFDKIECHDDSYFIAYWQKKKWWQWCKKKKLMLKTISNCGNTNIQEIEITK